MEMLIDGDRTQAVLERSQKRCKRHCVECAKCSSGGSDFRSMLLLLLLLLPLISEAASNFSLGSVLAIAGSPNPSQLLSSNGVFAFGFVDGDGGGFNLGIWYVADPQKFLVWKPPPPAAGRGALVELTNQGQLQLFASSARSSLLWSSANAGGATRGFLENSGAVVLRTANGSAAWSSFDHPTDTLLPNQLLVAGGAGLAAAASYSLLLPSQGNLTLLWNRTLAYWSAVGNTAPAAAAAMDENGVLNLLANTSDLTSYVRRFYAIDYGPPPSRRLTLDADGNLRIYTLSGGVWAAQWAALEDQCQVYAYCGAFGICSYDDDAPVCSCPPGLSPLDRRNLRLGCSTPANCGSGSRMVPINRTRWLFDASQLPFSIGSNLDACREQCISNAGCLACMVSDDGRCIQFRSTFLSAFSHPYLRSSASIKLCGNAGGATPQSRALEGPSCTPAATTAGVAVAATIAAVGLVQALIWFGFRRRWQQQRRQRNSGGQSGYTSGGPMRFSYNELQVATRNFSERIGGGGFGAVYKGVLLLDDSSDSRKMEVAVKKLEGVLQGDKEFRAEVATIGSTHHLNLMHLVGFCSEGATTRILVYEFMPNGSLDALIFPSSSSSRATSSSNTSSNTSSSYLDIAPGFDDRHEWKRRLAIAIGAAKGVAYLHEECRDCIIHCDLKPDNILLDAAFCPKVSDFGLARMMLPSQRGQQQQMIISSSSLASIRGTRGYLAPEWLLSSAAITPKADVFSYGVILVEIVTGKRSVDERSLLSWVYREMEESKAAANVLDPRVVDADHEQLERLLRVAFWCLQDTPEQRPSMSKVVHMLEATLPVSPPPMPRSIVRHRPTGVQ